MSELKSVSDLTVSVEKLEAAAKKNADRIAALEAAALPSEDNSAALDVLAARVDAVVAKLDPPAPADPVVTSAPAA